MLHLHKIEPSTLRPIHRIEIRGHAYFDNAEFPLNDDEEANVSITWRTGKRETLSIRFGVRSSDGNGYSQTWRVITERGRGRSDLYVMPAGLRNAFKVSLHESGSWQYGFTQEYARTPEYSRLGARERRHWEIWERPKEIGPGITRAFQVIIPSASARHGCPDRGKLVSWATVGSGEAIEFNVLLTDPARPVDGWPGKRSMGTNLAGQFELENGEITWVVYRTVPLPKLADVRIPADAMQKLQVTEGNQYSIALTGNSEDGSRFIIEAPLDTYGLIRAVAADGTKKGP